MPNYNSVTFIGHLARDPEVRFTQSGTAVCGGAIGVNYGWGENKDSFFLNFNIWGKSAENFDKWCAKGDAVLITGELQESKWQDKQTGEERRRWEVKVRDWTKVKTSSKRSQEGAAPEVTETRDRSPVGEEEMDSIPF